MSDKTVNALLRDQLEWHWQHQLRARLDGLTGEEYAWEPVPGCWNVRPRGGPGTPSGSVQVGSGTTVVDFAIPPPDPPPFTTIGWRLAHVNCGVLAMRTASHFGGPPTDYDSYPYAATAEQALAQLDDEHARWTAGVRALGDEGLRRPCGAAEGPYAELPMAALILHINREVIHHLAEVCLLRDLYRDTRGKAL